MSAYDAVDLLYIIHKERVSKIFFIRVSHYDISFKNFNVNYSTTSQQCSNRQYHHFRFIGIDEAAGFGTVVAGLEIVESGFSIIIISPVADGVDVADDS